MLGWEVFVSRQGSDAPVARWKTSVFGLKWLDALVEGHKALDLGGNGYPNKYSIAAGVLLPIITRGLPANSSPLVVGDDYVTPAGWSGDVTLNAKNAAACHPDEQLLLEAWDQS